MYYKPRKTGEEIRDCEEVEERKRRVRHDDLKTRNRQLQFNSRPRRVVRQRLQQLVR